MLLTILDCNKEEFASLQLMNEIYKRLKEFGHVRINVPLAKYTTFNIGGPADFLLTVSANEQLVSALNFLTGEGINWFILGGGSNVLFPDERFEGVVIKIKNEKCSMKNTTIEADAGLELSKVVEASLQASLTGFEWAAGIPGSVGGAVRGNAGARYAFTGGEIKVCLTSVSVWRDGEVVELSNADCKFGYRDSIFKHNRDVILTMQIQLKLGNRAESLAMTQKIIEERKGKHAKEPSAGSFFKNVSLSAWKRDPAELPERFRNYQKIAAGWLIEQAGLKGYRFGNAMISQEHGNFIVNLGGATQDNVLKIVEEVKSRVYNTFGVELEEEVQIVR